MQDVFKIIPTHLRKLVRFDVSLAKFTNYKIGGNAEFFIEPESNEQLKEFREILNKNEIKVKILAGGSNLLISDKKIPGAVISVRRLKGFSIKNNKILVNAGENLASVQKKSANAGLSGLETLAGIPGTVSGALIMNAGGKYGNISDFVKNVSVLDENNKIQVLQRDEIKFGKRSSSLSHFIVLNAEFELSRDNASEINVRREQILNEKVTSQPYHLPSAGCVFKNPENFSAGMLIDNAGLKGFKVGGAVVSSKHANFILNEENAKASEVIQVIRHIRQQVHEIHGIHLELEIKLWNLSI